MKKEQAKNKRTNALLYYMGNLLMGLSLLVFIYIVFPIVMLYVHPPIVSSVVRANGTYITIPSIHAQALVAENVDPFNKSEYMQVLEKSVAHAKGTALPGKNGTIFIFAHSSGPPWALTRMNTVFLRLGDLKKGNIIEIQRKGKVYAYSVREKKVVAPSQVQYITSSKKDQLILQTCTPIGTDWQRLLVFADPR